MTTPTAFAYDGRSIPASLRANATGEGIGGEFVVEAAAGGGKRFRGLAYSGGPLTLKEYPVPVVVDLAGITAASQSLPMPKDHDPRNVIGQTDSVDIHATNGITVSGEIHTDKPDGELIVAAGKGGLKWELSIGAPVQAMERVDKGETVRVNGRTFAGPLLVARRTTLQEVSFVRRGADVGQTHAAIAAKLQQEEEDMSVEAMRGEAARIAKIQHAAREYPAIMAQALEEGWDLQKTELHVLRASRPVFAGIAGASRSGTGLTVDHITAGVMVKAGHGKAAEREFGAKVMEESKILHRMHLADIAAIALQVDGRSVPSNRGEMIQASLSGGTMTTALGNAANKILQETYRMAPATWRSFCSIKSVSDFKDNTAIRPSFIGNLDELPSGVGMKHGSVDESYFVYSVDTFARRYVVDRRDILNDDVGVFQELAPSLGRAAARTVADLVYGVLLSNPSSFFGSGNANVATTGSALAIGSLGNAAKVMRLQVDGEGNNLDLSPSTLVVPPSLEVTARQLVSSGELFRDQSDDNQPSGNPMKGFVDVQVEPRLETGLTYKGTTYSGSAAYWYLFASPAFCPFVAAFLDGNEGPTIKEFGFDSQPDRLEMAWRCHLDVGAATGDYRAAFRATGAA